MAEFNWVDYIIVTIFFFSVLAGLFRGIVKELLSLLTWIAAIIVSSMLASKVASAFTGSQGVQTAITDSSNAVGINTAEPISILALGMSFVCIFLATLIIGSIITHIISGAVDSAGLGIANRMFGGIFGLIRGFLINLVLVFIMQLTTFAQEPAWNESKLVPYFKPAAAWIGNLVAPGFEGMKNKVGQTLKEAAESMTSIYQYRG